SVKNPALVMPAPKPVRFPLAMVNPEMVTVFPDSMMNTPVVLLPLTVITEAPGPEMVSFLVTDKGPRRVMVPVRRAWKSTVPLAAVAVRACRSEPAPVSASVVTVVGTQRPSSASNQGRCRIGRGAGRRRNRGDKRVNQDMERDESMKGSPSGYVLDE